MKKGPWETAEEDDPSTLIAYEEFRQYRALNRRYHAQVRRQHRRERLFRFGLPVLVALGSGAVVWAFLAYGPSPSFGSSPSVPRVHHFGSSSFRTCAEARAAGAAPLARGEPGYASHLDADGDGIACEWSWRNWFR